MARAKKDQYTYPDVHAGVQRAMKLFLLAVRKGIIRGASFTTMVAAGGDSSTSATKASRHSAARCGYPRRP